MFPIQPVAQVASRKSIVIEQPAECEMTDILCNAEAVGWTNAIFYFGLVILSGFMLRSVLRWMLGVDRRAKERKKRQGIVDDRVMEEIEARAARDPRNR